MATASLDDYAYLLLPEDETKIARVVEAPAKWERPARETREADVFLWGRVPYRRPPSVTTVWAHVRGREKALRRARRDEVQTLRLAPPPGRNRGVKARAFLLGGALLELHRAEGARSKLEAVVAAAGVTPDPDTFATGSDRAGTMRVRTKDEAGVLRAAPVEEDAGPASAADVLEFLDERGVALIPRVLERGAVASTAYVVESEVPGTRPRRLSDEILAEVAAWLALLPVGKGSPVSAREDVEALAIAVPERAGELLELLDRMTPHLDKLPAIVGHRDLWGGNVFVDGGRFSGVIDWDAAHLYAVPGTDLIHLFVSQIRERSRAQIGEIWLTRFWRSESFARATARYWRSLGHVPTQIQQDVIAVAWWAGWLRQAVTRHERLLGDEPWLAANMSNVLREAPGLL